MTKQEMQLFAQRLKHIVDQSQSYRSYGENQLLVAAHALEAAVNWYQVGIIPEEYKIGGTK